MSEALSKALRESPEGDAVLERLQARGFTREQIERALQDVLPEVERALHGAPTDGAVAALDLGKSRVGRNFAGAALASLLRGKGLRGSVVGGIQGAIAGHLAELLAARLGLPAASTGLLGAVVAPAVIDHFRRREPEAPPREWPAGHFGSTFDYARR